MVSNPDPLHPQSGQSNSTKEPTEAENERIVTVTVIEILAFAVGVGAAINFFFYALPRGDRPQIIIACAAAVIFATVGVAAHLLARPPGDERTDDTASSVLRKLTEQND